MPTTSTAAPTSEGHRTPPRPVPLAARDIDLAGFARDLDALKRELRAQAGQPDLDHLA